MKFNKNNYFQKSTTTSADGTHADFLKKMVNDRPEGAKHVMEEIIETVGKNESTVLFELLNVQTTKEKTVLMPYENTEGNIDATTTGLTKYSESLTMPYSSFNDIATQTRNDLLNVLRDKLEVKVALDLYDKIKADLMPFEEGTAKSKNFVYICDPTEFILLANKTGYQFDNGKHYYEGYEVFCEYILPEPTKLFIDLEKAVKIIATDTVTLEVDIDMNGDNITVYARTRANVITLRDHGYLQIPFTL